MDKSLYLTLSAVSQVSVWLPVSIGLLRYKVLSKIQRRIFLLALVYLLFEFLGSGYVRPHLVTIWGKENNLPFLHLFTLVQFCAIIWSFRDFLLQIGSRWLIYGSMIFFALFTAINAIFIDGIWHLNPHARALQSIILLLLIFAYFYRLLQLTKIKQLETDPLFWLSSGLLIYFSGNFLIFLSSNYLLQTTEVLLSIYSIHSILNVLANIFIAIALWVTPPLPKSISP